MTTSKIYQSTTKNFQSTSKNYVNLQNLPICPHSKGLLRDCCELNKDRSSRNADADALIPNIDAVSQPMYLGVIWYYQK